MAFIFSNLNTRMKQVKYKLSHGLRPMFMFAITELHYFSSCEEFSSN